MKRESRPQLWFLFIMSDCGACKNVGEAVEPVFEKSNQYILGRKTDGLEGGNQMIITYHIFINIPSIIFCSNPNPQIISPNPRVQIPMEKSQSK